MIRRTFIKSATGVVALASTSSVLDLFGQAQATGALEQAFKNPPPDAGLSVVHHWTGGVVTKEGITADLEAMAASGINIVTGFISTEAAFRTVSTWPRANLPAKAAAGLETWAAGTGEWTLKMKSGKTVPIKATVVAPVPVDGEWDVSFPVRNTVKRVKLSAGSWTENSDEDVKFFSGTATYSKDVPVTAAQKAAGKRLLLDLGNVQNLVKVRLNGKDLGVLWKAPYVADITSASVVGSNKLELEVTNTWVNRIAGDEGKPQEQRVTWAGSAGRGRGGGAGQQGAGRVPQVLSAGLIGPVKFFTEVKV